MSYSIFLQPEAIEELAQSKEWYNERESGLGNEFVGEVDQILNSILENPMIGPEIYRGLRRRTLKRFPYLIFYRVQSEQIDVVSIFHASQNPKKWKERG